MDADTLNSARILIVDDEPVNVRLLERMLQEMGCPSYRSTTDSRKVEGLYAELGPDLILLDLMMPHLDGLEVMRRLKRRIADDDYVPILVLTADSTMEARRRALAAGAKDFLTKPFDQVELGLRVRNLLETRFLHLALRRHSEDLERQVEERTRQLLQTEKLATMGTLLAGVAHELNNPLSVVLGQASLLIRTAPDEAVRARGEKINRAAERCGRIVKNFLLLARQRPDDRQRVGLNQIVEEAVELLGYPLRVDNVEVSCVLDSALPPLWADGHQLGQVFVNLISNAHHAMRASSGPRRLRITTGAEPSGGTLFVEVADSGPGVPPDIRAKLFEPFFTTKPPGEGTGLGLYLCQEIVGGHGGSLALVDRPGMGAVFRIELPVVTEFAAAPAEAEPEASRAAGKTILVVDDEPEVAEVLAEMLARDGHTVETAGNGVEALERIAGSAYDLVLCDLKMPRLDGPGFYRELDKRDPALARRVVFVSGDGLSQGIVAFLDQVTNPRLGKPFSEASVRQVVREALAT